MDSIYVIILGIVAVIVFACFLEVLRLRSFLHKEKEKRLLEQSEKSCAKTDSSFSDVEREKVLLESSPEYDKIKDEEKETHDQLLNEVLERVNAEEQRTQKRLEQDVVQEIIRSVIRDFCFSEYQQQNQEKLKTAKTKKRGAVKDNIAKEKERRKKQENARRQKELLKRNAVNLKNQVSKTENLLKEASAAKVVLDAGKAASKASNGR